MIYLILILIPLVLLVVLFSLKARSMRGGARWYRKMVRWGDRAVLSLAKKTTDEAKRAKSTFLRFERKTIESLGKIFYSTKRRIAKWAGRIAHKLSE